MSGEPDVIFNKLMMFFMGLLESTATEKHAFE